jgi:hypothetical protein
MGGRVSGWTDEGGSELLAHSVIQLLVLAVTSIEVVWSLSLWF